MRTEITYYNGHISYREVSMSDTTQYMDDIVHVLDNDEDLDEVLAAAEKAVEGEWTDEGEYLSDFNREVFEAYFTESKQ